MRILYDSRKTEYKKPFGVLMCNEDCNVNIKIPCSCLTKNVKIVFEKENGDSFSVFSMYKSDCENGYDSFSCTFSICDAGLYFYYFNIETEGSTFDLYKQGECDTNMCVGEKWQVSVISRDFVLPEKFIGKTMYQIFPDRFFRYGKTDEKGKCEPYTIHENWNDVPVFLPDENGKITNSDFFGGNIKGIIQKLGYLKELGVGMIYLNPIFKAYSNHRYDTCDYRMIDELLGNEEDFRQLCEAAHKSGMYVILDGVFSHTGSDSIYFDKYGKYGSGACSGEKSPYYKWYSFRHFPDDYESWWGIDTLPNVKELEESYIDYQIENEDSTLNKWTDMGADGWRLDVADELPELFIKKFRNKLKEKKSDSILIGEVWEDASNKISYGKRRSYFTNGELDSVMNYPFRNAILSFVKGEDDGEKFTSVVNTISENYPKDVLNLLMNFLSTHDTQRAFTLLGDAQCESKNEKAFFRLSKEKSELAYKRNVCAFVLLFVLPGIPSVFYGEEICLEGFEDPFCRATYDWEKQSPMREHIKRMSKIHSEEVFAKGSVISECKRPGVLRIERSFNGKTAVVYVNSGDEVFEITEEKIPVYSENFDGKNLFGYGFVIFD